MADFLGDFAAGASVVLWWNTNAIAGESITRATDGSIRIYKGSSDTQRSSSAGITDTEDADGVTGVHRLSIDLSDNTDAGFYAAGSDYAVVLVGADIDGKTVNHALGQFSIENRNNKVNLVQWLGVAPLELTTQKVNSYDADANADLATLLSRTAGGVTVVSQSTTPTGTTRIGKGKRYTGSDRLTYTSDTQRDLSTNTLVALQFNGKSFTADSITGSAGAWTILVPLTNVETDALFLGTFDGELSVYDTSPNPDQEIPELAKFKVTVYANV